MKKILLLSIFLGIGFAAVFFVVVSIQKLDSEIRLKFDGTRWSLPAVVYARSLELYPGLELSPEMLEKELLLAGYRQENPARGSGSYFIDGSRVQLVTRDFIFSSGLEKSAAITIIFDGARISLISDTKTGAPVPSIRLDPAGIGSFHPLVHEDRIVLKTADVPPLLRAALMVVEDKDFLSHHGISPSGIVRAFLANIKAGKTVQGGSTLTQQLVKNFFLNQDRTLSRKAKEAIMAVLLELHYSKDEILTAYINEVFLGQDGARALHGFGLASQFYFRRDIGDLSISQIATLVGMVKGPSLYDPVNHPDRSLERRNVVLGLMGKSAIINRQELDIALALPLLDVAPQKHGFNRFPDFLELVRRQLGDEYREESLQGSGLKILTTLDPQVQWQVEKQMKDTVAALEKRTGRTMLQGSMIVTGRDNGEIAALAGSRKALDHGFNRALDARRPIGSLVKPAVYLSALAGGYTLASPLWDTAISLETGKEVWTPKNYDKKEHGQVALYQALSRSYNLATVRLGMEVGLENVIDTMGRLGYPDKIEAYPSLLLGSVAMSPLQVTQSYQTIASGGFYLPLRSIQSVIAADGSLLTRYGLEVEQRFSPEIMFLLSHALKRVMTEGTGSSHTLAAGVSVAGKTGTSDGLRDSWFAGFSEDRLAVVWLGRDDNEPIALTGASGALIIWDKVMTGIQAASLVQSEPANISWSRIDTKTLLPTTPLNPQSTLLPFVTGSEPVAAWTLPRIDTGRIEKQAGKILDILRNLIK